jgi:hypothetical protein
MKEKEIKERNKQIALMLDLNHDEEAVVFNMHSYSWDMLIFHKDWNWLMEAVEFIEKLNGYCYSVYTLKNTCQVFKHYNTGKQKLVSSTIYSRKLTKKEAVFIAVSDFAKLYNENKL